MSPALLPALEREQEIAARFVSGELELASYEVLAVVTRADCGGCLSTTYERIERVGGAREFRATPAADTRRPSSGFGLVEVDPTNKETP